MVSKKRYLNFKKKKKKKDGGDETYVVQCPFNLIN